MCSSTPYTVSIVLLWSSYSHLTNRHSTVIGRVHLYPFTSLVDVKMNITSILQCNFVFSLPSTEMSVHLASFFICSPSPVSPLSRLLSCTPLIFRCLPLSFLTPEMLSVLTGEAAGETDRLECQAAGMLWVEEGEKKLYIHIHIRFFPLEISVRSSDFLQGHSLKNESVSFRERICSKLHPHACFHFSGNI